jgi:hypothetical protein
MKMSDKTTVEFSTGAGKTYGPFDMDRVMGAIVLEPEKYKGGGPYIYTATRPFCDCPLAFHPHGFDPKAAGRVLAEWGKAGWMVRTVSKHHAHIEICQHKYKEDQEPLVYVAERYCGCCVGVQPAIPGSEAGVAKVLQVWAEQGYYIQSIPLGDVYIEAHCPHQKPKEKQEMLPGLASADVEGLDDD